MALLTLAEIKELMTGLSPYSSNIIPDSNPAAIRQSAIFAMVEMRAMAWDVGADLGFTTPQIRHNYCEDILEWIRWTGGKLGDADWFLFDCAITIMDFDALVRSGGVNEVERGDFLCKMEVKNTNFRNGI